MKIALDTNVLQALLQQGHPLQARAVSTIKSFKPNNEFTISPFVYAEAFAMPNFKKRIFHDFLNDMGISVDKDLPVSLWEEAGKAHAEYHQRRKRYGKNEQKRILADFLIGAHALCSGMALITFDPKGYRAAFPDLELLINFE